ncbi:hypothetical protein LTS10_012485 [Elasticomyces elasticus]|nr:hypothetical protein LTS10_012485 [Elasticomyces elasticus]
MEPSALLRLPSELRNQIYGLVLHQEGGIIMRQRRKGWLWKRRVLFVPDARSKSTVTTARSLQLACRSTNVESAAFFWDLNNFIIECLGNDADKVAKEMKKARKFVEWLGERRIGYFTMDLGKQASFTSGATAIALPILWELSKSLPIRTVVQCRLIFAPDGWMFDRMDLPVRYFCAMATAGAHFARTVMMPTTHEEEDKEWCRIVSRALEEAAQYWSEQGVGTGEPHSTISFCTPKSLGLE